jgi:hypothetical protein
MNFVHLLSAKVRDLTAARQLRNQSSRPEEDVRSFAEALVFNWLIAGTDAVALYLTCRWVSGKQRNRELA